MCTFSQSVITLPEEMYTLIALLLRESVDYRTHQMSYGLDNQKITLKVVVKVLFSDLLTLLLPLE